MNSTETVQFALAKAGDQDVIETLLRRHEGLLVKIVCRYAVPRSAHFDDLKQAGLLALWQAITSFEPKQGNAFSTWAYPWILNAVSGEAHNTSLIRTPKNVTWDNEETRQLKKTARATVSFSLRHPGGVGELGDSLFANEPTAADKYEEWDEWPDRLRLLHPWEQRVLEAHINGMLFREVGAELGISRQTAKRLWDRALAGLREMAANTENVTRLSTGI